jgi:hypothetical protein
MIRTRIAAAATALFVALFGVIGIRLASGHDPALATSTSTSGTTSTTPATTTTATDEDDVTTSDQSSQAVSPVTTSQS